MLLGLQESHHRSRVPECSDKFDLPLFRTMQYVDSVEITGIPARANGSSGPLDRRDHVDYVHIVFSQAYELKTGEMCIRDSYRALDQIAHPIP